jgi:transposase
MLPLSTRVFVCTEAQDMRRSFDRLAQEVRAQVGEDPQCGALFVFVSRSGTRVKVLWWERNGYCLLYKRLHRALFVVPSGHPHGAGARRIDGPALAQLLTGVAIERSQWPRAPRLRGIERGVNENHMGRVDSA